MVHCILCGTGNDVGAQYCAGYGCGADLAGQREGDPSRAVQVAADPTDVLARPGDTVEVALTVRNAGSAPDKFVLELKRDIGDRVTVERHGAPGDVAPGADCRWTVRYTVPQDWDPVGNAAGVGGLFGLPGADAAGAFSDAAADDLELPLRVVSTQDRRIAAGALVLVRPLSAPDFDAARGVRHTPAQSRRTQLMAAGAVAAVAVVAALIVGMASAGTGGGDKKDPTKRAAATSTAPSTGADDTTAAAPGDAVTDDPATATSTAPTRTATRTRTSAPPSSKPPATSAAPATSAPQPPSSSASSPSPPRTTTMPNFGGMDLAAARAAARTAQVALSSSSPKGSQCEKNPRLAVCVVRSQSVPAGTTVDVNTPVSVVIDLSPIG